MTHLIIIINVLKWFLFDFETKRKKLKFKNMFFQFVERFGGIAHGGSRRSRRSR